MDTQERVNNKQDGWHGAHTVQPEGSKGQSFKTEAKATIFLRDFEAFTQ